jgi:hypothetical protein
MLANYRAARAHGRDVAASSSARSQIAGAATESDAEATASSLADLADFDAAIRAKDRMYGQLDKLELGLDECKVFDLVLGEIVRSSDLVPSRPLAALLERIRAHYADLFGSMDWVLREARSRLKVRFALLLCFVIACAFHVRRVGAQLRQPTCGVECAGGLAARGSAGQEAAERPAGQGAHDRAQRAALGGVQAQRSV